MVTANLTLCSEASFLGSPFCLAAPPTQGNYCLRTVIRLQQPRQVAAPSELPSATSMGMAYPTSSQETTAHPSICCSETAMALCGLSRRMPLDLHQIHSKPSQWQ